MKKFPVDAAQSKVIKAFELLGFRKVRTGNHVSMERIDSVGTKTCLTLPNHPYIKGSTLRVICGQAGISRNDFLTAFDQA